MVRKVDFIELEILIEMSSINIESLFEIIYNYAREFRNLHPEGNEDKFWEKIEKVLQKYESLSSDWDGGVIEEKGEFEKLHQMVQGLPIYYVYGDGSVRINEINSFLFRIFETASTDEMTPKKLAKIALQIGFLESNEESMSNFQKDLFEKIQDPDMARIFADRQSLKQIEISEKDLFEIKRILNSQLTPC